MSDHLAEAARVDALDVFVRLLSGLDSDPDASSFEFYDRLCEAVGRMTSMRRVGLLLYDDARKLVVPVGSYGLPQEMLGQIYGTLEEAPIARTALAEDRVVEVSEGLERALPARYAAFSGVTTLTCTPVGAGGRWLGVIFADRGGGRFELTGPERHALWILGKTAALAASARIATTEHERARLLSGRIDLAREVHEGVMQRLFGVSLVIGSKQELSGEERARCAEEIRRALSDLQSALSRPLAPTPRPPAGVTLRRELARLDRHYKELPLEVSWELEAPLAVEIEPLAQSVLAEALRNAGKHARPSVVHVRVSSAGGAFTLEVRNDGVPDEQIGRGAGMGLRLAAFEALQRGGALEFGLGRSGEWRVRLVVPEP